MTKPKPPAAPNPIAILTAEIADYTKQLNEAQQQANTWQQKAFVASGALQACQALVTRLQSDSPKETPSAT